MRLALLPSVPVVVEPVPGFKVAVRAPTTALQARFMDASLPSDPERRALAISSASAGIPFSMLTEERHALTRFILLNLVDSISVNGEEVSPAEFADCADLSDADTRNAFFALGDSVASAFFPTDQLKKK